MERYFKCVKQFSVDMYDEDEFLIEDETKVIPVDSVWEAQEYASMSEIRLESELGWLEIDGITFEKHFVKI